jgi:hypothetical protein
MNINTKTEFAVAASAIITLALGFLSLKAWLLTLILGWFGVTVIGFWKAMVIIVALDLLIYSGSKQQ